ncbi:MAG TPA: DUF4340 domain-containing protein [Candidatus Hydrogenedentes bacterium]|nr:DUF4340 domain-containing protein [Candidatus Hydrogenedentota bacterium]
MKIKTIVPFLIILALLVGLVAWRKATEAPPAPIAEQIGLATLAPEGLTRKDIARVELYSGAAPDEKVVLERENDAWRIASLYNAPVNNSTLDGFLEKALNLKGEPRAKADTDARLSEFSLKDDEAFHVQLFKKGADAPVMDILVGKSADFRTVFVRKGGSNQIFVESANLRREAGVSDSGDSAIPKPTKWLQTTLLELDREKITRVALQYPEKELVFERQEVVVEKTEESDQDTEGEEGEKVPVAPEEPEIEYKWTLASGGFTETFKETELETLLSKFGSLVITNAVDPEKPADWGFEPPLYKATLSREGEDDVVLWGGRDKPGGDTYIKLEGAEPPLIYQIAKYNFEQIFPQGSKLFTLPEWTVEKEAVTRIVINRPDGLVTLEKEAEEWLITEPALSLDIQKTTLDNLVSAACSLKPVDYVDADRDVGPLDITLTLHTAAEETRTLHLGQPAMHTEGRYVRFDNNDAMLALSRADTEKLTPPVRDLYSLSVLDFDMDAVERITVAHDDLDLLLDRDEIDESVWRRTINGKGADASLNDVEEFVYTLNAFQVDNFLLDQTPDAVQPATIITVYQTDKTPVMLQLSGESDGSHQAVISGLPYVFSVKSDELARILEDMDVFTEMPEESPEDTDTPMAEDISADNETNTVIADENESSPEEQESVVVLPADIPVDTTETDITENTGAAVVEEISHANGKGEIEE